MEKQILILKIGGKYKICDRMIFNLIQCGVQEGRKISDALDIFPYEYLAESLARLHNDGLIFLDVKMGASRLATKVQRLAEACNREPSASGKSLEEFTEYGQFVQNFSGIKK